MAETYATPASAWQERSRGRRARRPCCLEGAAGCLPSVLTRRDPRRIDVVAAAPAEATRDGVIVKASRGTAERLGVPESSRANADDRLPLDPLGRVEGGDGIVEGRDVADVGPQPSVPYPLDDLTQLGAIGLDDEVDCQAVGGPRLGRPYDGHQGSSGPDQACGPFLDVSADDVEDQVDASGVFQGVVLQIDELLRAEVERLLAVGGAPGADDVGTGLTCELRHHRPDCAGRAVREDALPRLKVAVVEQALPRGQAGDWQARAHGELDVARQRREVACLDRDVLRQGAVAMPVREAEHPLSN